EIPLLSRAKPQGRTRALLGPPALDPGAGILGRAAAPEQALGLLTRLPLLGRGVELREKLPVLLALGGPLLELRPAVDERLVDKLNRRALALAAGLDKQEPRVGEALDHVLHRAAILREPAELAQAYHRARALGRHQAQEHPPREPLVHRG